MIFDATEKHQSQIPALHLLVAMGFAPLSPEEALRLRGGRLRNVTLDDVLADQLLKLNRFTHRGRAYPFDLEDAHEAMRRLKPTPDRLKGLRGTNQDVYDTLVLGTTITKTIDGDSKSYSFRYIDWEHPDNNAYHVTAEMTVERAGSTKTRRCDIVAFVNGIPFIVIENKRPTERLKKADSQLIGYQREDEIPHLFHFAQILLSMNRREARYATVGTQSRFWQTWQEEETTVETSRSLDPAGPRDAEARAGMQDTDTQTSEARAGMQDTDTHAGTRETEAQTSETLASDVEFDPEDQAEYPTGGPLRDLVDRPLAVAEAEAVYSGNLASARSHYEAAITGEGRQVTKQDGQRRQVTEQDVALYALCRRERLLDLVRRFTVFDGGVRKIARHQQYFAVRRAVERVGQFDMQGVRRGGVIWHTPGTGKSLTMVMLGKALALEATISNPRIVIVTDRDDLDRQIKDTFKSCEREPVRATSGNHLISLIQDRTPLITTIINKFDTASRVGQAIDEDPNVFVLVDESHRTQTGSHGGFGQLAGKMRRILGKACYLGFTGTPLLQREKNTLATFGGLIHRYAIDQAVRDEAVVSLLYEGRIVEQQINPETIDSWFDKLSEGLSEHQRADLKAKYSRLNALARTEQAIHARAFDVSEHYRQHWQGSGFKAQLVAPSKAAACRYKELLDEIGHVTSEIVISPPDDHEGNEEVEEVEEVDRDPGSAVRAFWARMMDRYGTESEYNRQIIDAFKHSEHPEILIVVSKLLTGFDAPRNTVLYLCRSLREHNLLQAIMRVNRLYEEEAGTGREGVTKKHGFIIDYEGLLGELDGALTAYGALEGFESSDLAGTLEHVKEEIHRLRHLHERLRDVFKSIRNKKDMEAFEQFLADEARRQEFYEKLREFGRCLRISLSSDKIHAVYDDAKIDGMKRDWLMFSELRRSVRLRYQETIDVREFEPKIRKLLDDHVVAMPAETVVEPVNINDPDALKAIAEESKVTEASRADRIASATRRTVTEKMEEDPTFYRRFSELLEETISNYRAKRISERAYLQQVLDLAGKVSRKEDRGQKMPEPVRGNDDGEAFYGVLAESLAGVSGQVDGGGATGGAAEADGGAEIEAGTASKAASQADGAEGALSEVEAGKKAGESESANVALNEVEIANAALDIIEIIRQHHIVDVWSNEIAQNEMRNAIDDYYYDVLREQKGLNLTDAQLNDLENRIMNLAKARFPD